LYAQSNNDSLTTVLVGMCVNRIYEFSVRDQSFEAEFYLWLKWRGTYSPEKFEFVNGKNIERSYEVIEEDINGYKYLSVKIKGTFITPMNVSKYPKDKHILSITIEDNYWNETRLQYQIDTLNTGMRNSESYNEWRLRFLMPVIKSNSFPVTNERFSSYSFQIEAVRSISPFIVKILVPILLVVFMSMLTFFIPPNELEVQVGLGGTALLTIIALNFTISDQIPDVAYLTKADILIIGSYIIVFFALCESILVNFLHRNNKVNLSKYIDKICRYSFPLIYSLSLLFLFLL